MGTETVPITVGIPTFARGDRVCGVIEKLLACQPRPEAILVHVDQSDGELERKISARFPEVKTLSSPRRVGPGGGRHRCLTATTSPYFASFDDDSWPVDADYFLRVYEMFMKHPKTGVIQAAMFHPGELPPARTAEVNVVFDYVGCAYAIRKSAYLTTTGHVDRGVAYGIEEVDIALQLHAGGWRILRAADLRVAHDSDVRRLANPETVAGMIQNVALVAYLRYPMSLFFRASLQMGNLIRDLVCRGWWHGIARGMLGIPAACRACRSYQRKLPREAVLSYLNGRRRAGTYEATRAANN